MCCPGPEHGWIDFSAVAEISGAVPQEAEPLVPKLITYDRAGAPENAQDSRDQGEQEPKWTQLPWKEWQRSAAAQALDEEASDIAAITLALRTLHSSPQLREMPVNLWLNDSRQKMAFAASQIEPGCLELPPCVPKSGKVHATSTHPYRVPVTVKRVTEHRIRGKSSGDDRSGGNEVVHTYYLHPEFKIPEEVTPTECEETAPGVHAWK